MPYFGIYVLGISHQTASTDFLSRVALPRERIPDLLRQLRPLVAEVIVLSTCNRMELYVVAERDVSHELRNALADYMSVSVEEIAEHQYVFQDETAVRHLLNVAAGLDSMVIGESQIIGQVGEAWELASAEGATGATLNTLFRYAREAGKNVRSTTTISCGATSVAHAAVEIARLELRSLANRKILVLGAGNTGRAAALNLRSAGAEELFIINRTYARAEALAYSLRGTALPFHQLGVALQMVDMVLACATTTEPLVTGSMLSSAVEQRPRHPLLLVDIAVPRNIDSTAKAITGIRLYDMDDIHALCERNTQARIASARAAAPHIEAWVRRFRRWQTERQSAPLIRQMRLDAERIRRQEVDRALGYIPGLTDKQRSAIERLSHSLMNKLLHQPTVVLRQLGDEERERLATMWVTDIRDGIEREASRDAGEHSGECQADGARP